jgi:hypothetical protein
MKTLCMIGVLGVGIAERTFVQTLGPEQNGDFFPVLSGSSEAPECTPTWRWGRTKGDGSEWHQRKPERQRG